MQISNIHLYIHTFLSISICISEQVLHEYISMFHTSTYLGILASTYLGLFLCLYLNSMGLKSVRWPCTISLFGTQECCVCKQRGLIVTLIYWLLFVFLDCMQFAEKCCWAAPVDRDIGMLQLCSQRLQTELARKARRIRGDTCSLKYAGYS